MIRPIEVHTKAIREKEVFIMDHKSCNTSIKCSVNSCAHHNAPYNCCTLESIKVGCCDCTPTKCEGTECASFKLGSVQ